jgi:glucose 1-dehydrogenase
VAADYARDGIRANTVMVGFVLSNALAREWVKDPEVNARMRASHLTRFGEPEDVAHVIRFLASNESEFICGSEVFADGGSMVT